VIGLDLGTTNCRAVLQDADGQVKAKASDDYKLQVPHPGWAEQDVRLVWEAAGKVLRAVAESAPAAPKGPARPQGICISGAMHSLLPVADDAGTPILNAMTWADARATGAGLLGMHASGLIGADQMARTVKPGPVYTPDPGRLEFYEQHHREYRAPRRGMVAMGETWENLKEGSP